MLPFLKSTQQSVKKQIVNFRGLNYSDQIQDGDMRDCLNISARRYPYLTTRRGRQRMTAYEGATAMTARGSLVVVQGTNLVYGGTVVGQVKPGNKQFAVVNTKMVIWPDKVYLDLNTRTIVPLGASVSGTGASFAAEAGEITVDGWTDLTTLFSVGDGITITGCKAVENNLNLVVKSVSPTVLGFGPDTLKADAIEDGEITIERVVPDLEFICESENRLWGCSSVTQTIYASKLGDPTNFFAYAGNDEDSYAVAVGTEGDFTGCCKHSSSVLFWKETKLHKMLGGMPSEYALYTYDIEGLQKGAHKSMQIINEVLYYLGAHGVYAYSGGMPSLISHNFGEKFFTNGVAGNDGDSYYLSVWEGNTCNLMVYETRSGIWMREDATNAVDFARIGKDLYMLDDTGHIWLMDDRAEDPKLDWMIHFTPFHETIAGRKLFSKLLLRVELPKGAWLKVETRNDDGRWREAGKIMGRDVDSIPLHLPIVRCDKFEVKLSGYGPCTIKAMMLEYTIGSDV